MSHPYTRIGLPDRCLVDRRPTTGPTEFASATDAITVSHVTKTYRDTIALDDLSFKVGRGSIFGLIGSNGAGKSTTIGCLCGLLDPTSGGIRLFGESFGVHSSETKRRLGVMPEALALFDQLLATEFLEFNALMFGLDRQTSHDRTLELLEFLDLTTALSRPVGEFSAGMRKKVAFAAAVIHRPDLLLLDEPFANMDAAAVSMLKDWLRRYVCRGGTVLVTSHALDTIERFCDEVALIDRGRVIWQGDVAVLAHGGSLEAGGLTFRTLESLFLHLVGYCCTGPDWL